MVLVNKIIPQK